jgi:hypothetical protein
MEGMDSIFLDGSSSLPSLSILQSRIQESLNYAIPKKGKTSSPLYFIRESGSAWRLTVDKDQLKLLHLKPCSKSSPFHLETVLVAAWLGAGINLDDEHHLAVVESMMERRMDKNGHQMESFDLQRSNGELGAMVFALHNYLSKQLVANFRVKIDSCRFMDEVRVQNISWQGQETQSTSCSKHTNTKPVFVHFGDPKDVFLYLSQQASAAEASWP